MRYCFRFFCSDFTDSIDSYFKVLRMKNCTLFDDRRNVERKLAMHFQYRNSSSDIPAGVNVAQFIRKYYCYHQSVDTNFHFSNTTFLILLQKFSAPYYFIFFFNNIQINSGLNTFQIEIIILKNSFRDNFPSG